MKNLYTRFAAGKIIDGAPHVRRHGSWFPLSVVAKWQAESNKG